MKILEIVKLKAIVSAIITGGLLATMCIIMNAAPAHARDNNNGRDRRDNERYEHNSRGYDHNARPERNRRIYRQYGYRKRVYVPPPVMYAPAPPPPPGYRDLFPSPVHSSLGE